MRIVSRYGTCGWWSSTSAPNRLLTRSTATSTWIWLRPESSCSPVCGSRRITSVGSSSERRRSAVPTFSSSPFAFGVTAKLITGSGKPSSGISTSRSASSSRSPVVVSFSLATAPMSPAPKASSCVCSLPCSASSWPTRSFECERWFASVESDLISPAMTRRTLIRPAKGSAIVLNTNAEVPSSPTPRSMCFFAGEGTPSTSRSRRAVVPRFFVATAQATGKISPRVTASLSA